MKIRTFVCLFKTAATKLSALTAICSALLGSLPCQAASYVWTGGGGANGNWNNSANWGSVGIPGNGDTVVFQGAVGLNSTNNLTGLVLNQIRFINSGFKIYGNPFTVTNSIVATNFTGTAVINNSNNVATAEVTVLVSNTITLTMNGNIGGSVGVIKTGAGTLLYQAAGNNTYTGTTLVLDGLLQLNVSGSSAFSGPLVIGDVAGSGNPIVRHLQSTEIPETVPITINTNGILDLNSFNETIGTILNISSGTVTNNTGTLTLSPNATINATNYNFIYGNLNVGSSGTCTIQAINAYFFLYANISGAANIVQNSGGCLVFGTNTFTGTLTINESSAY
jgi:autotransporter-associated beta strand protein